MRNWPWVFVAIIALIAIFLVFSNHRTSESGQPAPHALDQSQ